MMQLLHVVAENILVVSFCKRSFRRESRLKNAVGCGKYHLLLCRLSSGRLIGQCKTYFKSGGNIHDSRKGVSGNRFATLSTGEKIQAPDYSQLDRRIRRLQKGLARRQKGSKRRNKRRLAIARTYNRIADLRLDFLHKLSTQLAQIYQAIVLENLNVSGMLKNRRLARAIAQQGWSIFKALLEFKAAKYLRELQVISRWEPTSQICSDCGYRWGKLDLSVRRLKCLSCGAIQDRDINAAKNIVAVGLGHRKTQNRTLSGCKTTFGGNLRESV